MSLRFELDDRTRNSINNIKDKVSKMLDDDMLKITDILRNRADDGYCYMSISVSTRVDYNEDIRFILSGRDDSLEIQLPDEEYNMRHYYIEDLIKRLSDEGLIIHRKSEDTIIVDWKVNLK